VGEQRIVLEHHANSTLLGRQDEAAARDDLPFEQHAALMHRFETGDRPQGRGFTASGGAQQAADIAPLQAQLQLLDHALLAVTAGQVAQFQ
jgi:hypothetical protein